VKMRTVFAIVVAVLLFTGFGAIVYSAHMEQSTVEEQLKEPLNAGDVQTEEETQGINAPNVSRPEMSGEMYYDTYDENTGFPDVTESDRMGEVGMN